jgi:hypothetical protein
MKRMELRATINLGSELTDKSTGVIVIAIVIAPASTSSSGTLAGVCRMQQSINGQDHAWFESSQPEIAVSLDRDLVDEIPQALAVLSVMTEASAPATSSRCLTPLPQLVPRLGPGLESHDSFGGCPIHGLDVCLKCLESLSVDDVSAPDVAS